MIKWGNVTRARLLSLAMVSLILWLFPTGEGQESLGEVVELWSLNLRFKLRPPPDRSSPVTLTIINGQRVRPPGRQSRDDLADLLETLVDLPDGERPSAIVIDVALTHGSRHQPGLLSPGERIAKATATLNSVVHSGIFAYSSSETRDPPRDMGVLKRHSVAVPKDGPGMRVALGVRLAHPDLAEALYSASRAVGFISLPPLIQRHTIPSVYDLPLLTRYRASVEGSQDRVYLATALAGVAATVCGDTPIAACVQFDRSGIAVKGAPPLYAPISADGAYWINYRKRYRTHVDGETRRAWTDPARAPEVVLFQPPNQPTGGAVATGVDCTPPDDSDPRGWFSDLDGSCIPAAALRRQIMLVVDGQERQIARSPLGPDYPLSSVHAQAMANFLEADPLRRFPTAAIADRVPPSLSAALMALLLLMGLIAWEHSRSPRSPRREGTSRTHILAPLRTPELLLMGAWITLSWALFATYSLWIPVAAPLGLLLGSLLGWLAALPLELSQELQRLQAFHVQNEALLADLKGRSQELEVVRSELSVRRTEALQRGAWTEKDEALLAQSAEDLKGLDQVLSETHETLSRYLLPAARFQPMTPVDEDVESLLEQLRRGKVEVQQVKVQVEQVQQKIDRLEPQVDFYREAYQAWAPAYRGLFRPLQAILDQAGNVIARLSPELAQVPNPGDDIPEAIDEATSQTLFERTGLKTRDPDMAALIQHILEVVGPSDEPVMIFGETGAGKELVARAVHTNSPRAREDAPFVVQNCANLPPTLAESALFGHMKGAHSTADRARTGLFVDADGGTLVLDELGEMPLEVQPKLLRVLQDMTIIPLGGDLKHARKVDVRVIASTNTDLELAVREGRFRADLFYRLLRMNAIQIPPLRERRVDIPLLLNHFLGQVTGAAHEVAISDEALAYLSAEHDWPGNVRELEGVAVRLAKGREKTVDLKGMQQIISGGGASRPRRLDIHQVFSRHELHRLGVMRQHNFKLDECGEDPHYPGNRKTADRHLRVFICIALWARGWDLPAAAKLLVGADHMALAPVVVNRMTRFLTRLEGRLRGARNESLAHLHKSIKREYAADHHHILRVLDALDAGWVQIEGSD